MKKTTKLLTAIFLLAAIFSVTLAVSAVSAPQETPITVIADGKTVALEQNPQLSGSNVMVPIKAIAEAAGWKYQEKISTVFEVWKSSMYTDGVKQYLFSCHTSTINLDTGYMNRSIMVGVGKFFDKPEDHNIQFSVKPVIVNGITMISANDLAKCMYASAEWEKENSTLIITSGEIPYYDGQGLANRDELFERMKSFQKADKPLTRVGGKPAVTPTTTETDKKITDLFEPSGVMKSAPEVGSIPAKILLPGKTNVKERDSFYEAYKWNVGGGCNWYAFGRFYETYGWRNPVSYNGGKVYLDKVENSGSDSVKAERDLSKIVSGCIAVYSNSTSGHGLFVEYVGRDADGKPVDVYYTECLNSDKSGEHKPDSDGKVVRVTFERFKKSSSGTKNLMGYVMPK